jgi:hypothetical protein
MMRQRGVSTVGAVVLAALAGVVTAAALSDWVVVDVETLGPDSMHIVVPVPLMVGRIAAAAVPDEALEDAVMPPEVTARREQIVAAVRSLADTPDATFVEVHDGDDHVVISKVGGLLKVAVDSDDARVRCTLPIDAIADALEEWDWQTVDPGLAFDILGAVPSGELLTVEAEDARVAIRMW